jgi:hypothetical protein
MLVFASKVLEFFTTVNYGASDERTQGEKSYSEWLDSCQRSAADTRRIERNGKLTRAIGAVQKPIPTEEDSEKTVASNASWLHLSLNSYKVVPA